LITTLTITTADAGPGIKITSADFGLSSLTANGILKGTGQADVTVVLKAEGTCKVIPYQYPGLDQQFVETSVTAAGKDVLSGSGESGTKKKNTRRPFEVETDQQVQDQYDQFQVCHNDSDKTEDPHFILWTKATIFVYSGIVEDVCDAVPEACDRGIDLRSSAAAIDNPVLLEQVFNCFTDPGNYTVTCTPENKGGSNGSGNGAVGICHATGNTKNPYVLIKVNPNGLNGHSRHAGDIIPAPADGCPN
jgi:hypothetical protein